MDTNTNYPEMNITEVELSYKQVVKKSDRQVVVTSKDAFIIFSHVWDKNKIDLLEEFKVLLLNRGNQVLGIFSVSSGGITGTVADPRLILIAALKSASTSIVLCHNHPSGNLKPSQADESLTRKIKQACYYIDITVIDHLIISREEYFSFADEGLL